MKITLESTEQIIEMSRGMGPGKPIRARVWEGETASGIKIHALIVEVAVPKSEDSSEFDRDLAKAEHRPQPNNGAWPLRYFLD